jgi:hypothetical protein
MIVANSIESNAAAPSPLGGAELRGAQRFKTMMRTAKLIGLTGEFLAVIRDVSDTGLKLKLFHPVPEERMALELADGSHFFIEKVWERETEAGFRFSAPIDVASFLTTLGRKDEGRIWLSARIPGIITVGDIRVRMTINNLSRHGAELESGVLLAAGDPVVLSGEGLPQVCARISQICPSHYCVEFENIMRLDDLAQVIWAASRQETVSCQAERGSRIRSASRAKSA